MAAKNDSDKKPTVLTPWALIFVIMFMSCKGCLTTATLNNRIAGELFPRCGFLLTAYIVRTPQTPHLPTSYAARIANRVKLRG